MGGGHWKSPVRKILVCVLVPKPTAPPWMSMVCMGDCMGDRMHGWLHGRAWGLHGREWVAVRPARLHEWMHAALKPFTLLTHDKGQCDCMDTPLPCPPAIKASMAARVAAYNPKTLPCSPAIKASVTGGFLSIDAICWKSCTIRSSR